MAQGSPSPREQVAAAAKKKPARLLVPLPDKLAALLRETAHITSYTQAELLTSIEKSRQFAVAVETVLREQYMQRLREGERLFAKPAEMKAEEPGEQ